MSPVKTGPGHEVAAALLDVDGTLVDSNAWHAMAWQEALGDAGYACGYDEVFRLIGMGGDKIIPRLTGLDPRGEAAQALQRYRGELFRERYLSRVEPWPRVRDLIGRMRDEGLDLVVATSSSAPDLAAMLSQAGLDDLLDKATAADDVAESKPAPDVLRAALALAETTPAHARMLGDTPYDVEAAHAAGVGIVALRCGGWDSEALAGALAVYDDPAQLLRDWEDSPFVQR